MITATSIFIFEIKCFQCDSLLWQRCTLNFPRYLENLIVCLSLSMTSDFKMTSEMIYLILVLSGFITIKSNHTIIINNKHVFKQKKFIVYLPSRQNLYGI